MWARTAAVALMLVGVQLAFALEPSNSSVQVVVYDGPHCTGSSKTYPWPTGVCATAPSGTNFTSSQCSAPKEEMAVEVYLSTSAKCSNRVQKDYLACNKCTPSSIGYYRYHCHPDGQYVVFEDKCNSDCTSCGYSSKISMGQCRRVNFTQVPQEQYAEFTAVTKTTFTVESLYHTSNCYGAPAAEWTYYCGLCNQRKRQEFICSTAKGSPKGGKKHADDSGAQNSVAPNPLAPDTPTSKQHHHYASGNSSKANTRSSSSSSSSSSSKGVAVGVLGAIFVMSMVVIAFLLHQKRQQLNRRGRRSRTGGFTNPNDDDDIDIESSSDVGDLDHGNEPATAAAAGADGGSKNDGVQVGQIVMDHGTVASLPAHLQRPPDLTTPM